MSDNPTSGSDTILQSADLFYESEPEVPTDDKDTADPVDNDVDGETETEQETDAGDKPTVHYDYDETAQTYSFKSNGETVTANIDKLIENYSKGEGFTQKTTDLANQRKALETDYGAKATALEQQEQNLQAVAQELTKVFLEQEQAINWEELRRDDIAEYTRQRELQQQRRESLAKAVQASQQGKTSRDGERLQAEFTKLYDVMQWADTEAKEAGLKEIGDYLKSIGTPKEALKDVWHHTLYRAFHDAAQYRKLKSETAAAVKKVKAAPTSVKSKKSSHPSQQRSAEDILYGT